MSEMIVPFHESKYILLSSALFLIPAYSAIQKSLYFHSIILFLTFTFSVNYWRNATYSWRRNLDLIWAKGVFVVFLFQGMYFIRNASHIFAFYYNIGGLLVCYRQSCFHRTDWLMYHMAFHAFSVLNLWLVVQVIPASPSSFRKNN